MVERNAARSSAWQALHLSLTFSRLLGAKPRVPHRSPPRKFLSSFFCKCNLRTAIDFAVLRLRSGGAIAEQLEEKA